MESVNQRDDTCVTDEIHLHLLKRRTHPVPLRQFKMETSAEEVSGLLVGQVWTVSGETLPSAGRTLSLRCFSDGLTGGELQCSVHPFSVAKALLVATQVYCTVVVE